jgi:alpha-1,6-mannosyltransferase
VRIRLSAVGVALAAAMIVLAGVDGRHQTGLFLAITAVASTLYCAAAWTVLRSSTAARNGLWVCLTLAAVCRVPLVIAEPTISDDIYRYVWDGRVQRLGHNPYLSPPADPALAALHTPVTRLTNHPELPTVYPPAAQWFFRGVTAIHESVLALKLSFVACDALIVLLMLRWLSRAGQSPWRVLVYAWNPLVVIEVAGSGHVDALGALLLLLSFLALSERKTLLAALSFVAAAEVKFLPIVLAPMLWRRIRVRDAVVALAVALALAVPFLSGLLHAPIGSLPTYLAKWRFNGPVFALAEHFSRSRWLVALPAAAGLAVAARLRIERLSPSTWAWPMAASLLLMPAVYPWYLVWITPYLGALETLPLLVWTQTVLLTYVVWHVWGEGGGWHLPWWVPAVEFGGVAGAAVWLAIRRARRPARSGIAGRGA